MKNILRSDRRSNIFDRIKRQVNITSDGRKKILVDELITPPSLRRARWLQRTGIETKCLGSSSLNRSLKRTWSKIKSTPDPNISKRCPINWEILKVSEDTVDQAKITSKGLKSSGNDFSMIASATNEVCNSTLLDNTSKFDVSVVQVSKCSSILPDKIVTRSIYKKLLSSNLKFSPSLTLLANTNAGSLKDQSKLNQTFNNLKITERLISPRRLRNVSKQKPNKDKNSACVPDSKDQVTTKQVTKNKRKNCDSNQSSIILPAQKRVKVHNKQNETIDNEEVMRKSHRLIELANNKTKVAVVRLARLHSSSKAVDNMLKEVPKRFRNPRQTKDSVAKIVEKKTVIIEAKSQESKNLREKEKKIISSEEDGKKLQKLQPRSKAQILEVLKEKSKTLRSKEPEIAHKEKALKSLEDETTVQKKIPFPKTARKGTLKYKKALRQYLNEKSKEENDQDYLATPFRNNALKLGGLNINKMSLFDEDDYNMTPRSECSLPSPATATTTPLFRSYFSPTYNIPAKRTIADAFNLNLKRRAKPKIKKTMTKKNKKVKENLDKIINKQLKAIKEDEESKGFFDDDDDDQ